MRYFQDTGMGSAGMGEMCDLAQKTQKEAKIKLSHIFMQIATFFSLFPLANQFQQSQLLSIHILEQIDRFSPGLVVHSNLSNFWPREAISALAAVKKNEPLFLIVFLAALN